jgi:TolB-like protein/DNA-binding winged helix-turn-helix (wHTH) protein/tetratricopeptide (TPR) repeat protein
MPDEPQVLRIGEWRVDPHLDEVSRGGQTIRLEPRTMRLLLYLAARAGRVIDVEHLLNEVWPNVVVTQGSVYQAVAELRRILGDDREHPSYIENLPRRGYRLIAPVAPWNAVHSAARSDATQAATGFSEVPNGPIRAELQSMSAGQDRTAKTGNEALVAPPPFPVARSRRTALLGGIVLAAVIVAGIALGAFWRVRHMQGTGARVGGKTEFLVTPALTTFAPPRHSIAVLPFVNISGDKEQEYFSDGLTEELLNSLSRINQLQVAARTSSFYFKGKDVDLPTIAHKLNVASVLEGSVRRSGNRVRVTAQLNNAVTGFHLWSQTYDRDLGDVLQLQTEIATAVASTLKVTLLGDVGTKIELGGTRNPAAFDAYVRGSKAYWTSPGGQQYEQAVIAGFTQAIRLDPEYALAYADRSLALISFAQGAKGSAALDYLNKAQADARKAIALAPDLAEGHLALAGLLQISLDFPGATTEYERASALAPGNARVSREYGVFAVIMGKTEVGLAAAHRGVVLDPLNPETHYWLGGSLVLARRYDEAIASFTNAKALSSNDPFIAPFIDGWIGLSYYLTGNFANARRACGRGDQYLSLMCLAMTYDKLGQRTDAETILAKLQSLRGDNGALAYAMICAQWGDKGKALEWLDKATRLHDPWLQYVKVFALFDPLREEPRFQAIERELKFPD